MANNNQGFFGAMSANNHYLTDIESVKLFMEEAGYLWRTILASTTYTPDTYLNIAPTGGGANQKPINTILEIAELRDLFAENAAYTMTGARQPSHFDHASALAAAVRSVEASYSTAVKNAVSSIVTKWDTFIKSEAVAASGSSSITTTKAYIDSLFNVAAWQTELGADKFGADFLDFWRYVMRSELSIPICTFTSNGTTWTRAAITNATSATSGGYNCLTYGSALEARLTTAAGSTTSITKFATIDTTGAAPDVTLSAATVLDTVYTDYASRVSDQSNKNYVAIGTKTNLITITGITSTGTTNGDVITIYSV